MKHFCLSLLLGFFFLFSKAQDSLLAKKTDVDAIDVLSGILKTKGHHLLGTHLQVEPPPSLLVTLLFMRAN
jgi:hypothetical protein